MATAYRKSHIQYCAGISDGAFQIVARFANAVVLGLSHGYGWLLFEYDGSANIRVCVYANATDAQAQTNSVAESDIVATSSLPATVTLNEIAGSGVSGSVDVEGVN